jgi:hypothetical protein
MSITSFVKIASAVRENAPRAAIRLRDECGPAAALANVSGIKGVTGYILL